MARFFNTTGECIPGKHYMLPAEARLPGARQWVEREQYFVAHAPRQTGKTTALTALAQSLTREGKHVALRFSCERAEAGPDDIATTEALILDAVRNAAIGRRFPPEWMPPDPWPGATPGSRIVEGLQEWSLKCPLPLVLFFDEIATLTGISLNSVLRQLRDGFSYRGHAFPASIALCGMRRLRDYKLAAGADAPASPGRASPFNNAVTRRISDFTASEVTVLYTQHTTDTGQDFTPEAVTRAFEYTQGQPWLVNAIANEIIAEMGITPSTVITADHVDQAKERLIRSLPVHFDSLAARLREERVRRVMEPLITGTDTEASEADDYDDDVFDEDLQYVRDLGLIASDNPVRVANPIYREVIVGILGKRTTARVTDSPDWYLRQDGQLDFRKLLEGFTRFWAENGEFLVRKNTYHEGAAQIVFMAYLTRIVNGGGYLSREYGVGAGRIDILVRKPYGDQQEQREAVELKVWNPKKPDPLPDGLRQLDGYLDRLGLDTGTLIIFDRRPSAAPIHERIAFSEERSPADRRITVLRA